MEEEEKLKWIKDDEKISKEYVGEKVECLEGSKEDWIGVGRKGKRKDEWMKEEEN